MEATCRPRLQLAEALSDGLRKLTNSESARATSDGPRSMRSEESDDRPLVCVMALGDDRAQLARTLSICVDRPPSLPHRFTKRAEWSVPTT
jgi:hypothetical protein